MRFRSGLLSLALLAMTGLAEAQTISFADAVTVLAKECGADIKKHCAGVNLGDNAIQHCLAKHSAQVSPGCTSTLDTVTASISKRLAAQASVMKVCEHSAAQYCKGVKGEAHILTCLLKTERVDNAKCNQAITDAGWR